MQARGLDLTHSAVSAASRHSGKSSGRSPTHWTASIESEMSEPLTSLADEDLLDTLAIGRRFSRM
jgi:hypothetical protein